MILSKEIVSLLTFIVSTFVVFISLFIGLYHGGIKDLFEIISEILSINYDLDVINMIIWIVVTMLVSYISQVQIFYIAMLLGQTRNTNKVLFSFAFGIIIYIVMQFVSMISVGIDYLINPNLMAIFDSTTAPLSEVYDGVVLLLATTNVISILIMIVIHYISVYIVNNKLNLE